MLNMFKQRFLPWLYQHRYRVLIGLMILLWIGNMTIDIMEVDASQYASIAREMAASGQYLQVHQRGEDYLDKPPLLFWLTAPSIHLLGNSNVAAKLPAVLLLVLALWATYRLARMWYDHRTGLYAALIMGTSQAFHLMTLDVRTDGVLTCMVMLSVLALSQYLKQPGWKWLMLGGLAIGGAMLAKGPIGLIIPACAIGGHLLLNREWKKIFDPKWISLLLPIALVLAPMCYGLYQQYDLHPEKTTLGQKGVSGLRFFFWTQSFGRITGESTWNNHAPIYYFINTMLWDFQPWIAFFIPAMIEKARHVLRKVLGKESRKEWISLCGFLLPFLALSASRYKLPHYVFPLFPFAAIMVASFLVRHAGTLSGWFKGLQWVVLHFLFMIAIAILAWAFPTFHPVLFLLMAVLYAGMWWLYKKGDDPADRLILSTLSGVLVFQFVLTFHLYPHLLRYQASGQAGRLVKQENPSRVYWHDQFAFAFDYYSDRIVPLATGAMLDTLPAGTWIYVSREGLPEMPPHRVLHTYDDYRVANLNFTFIHPATRNQKLKKMYLIELR